MQVFKAVEGLYVSGIIIFYFAIGVAIVATTIVVVIFFLLMLNIEESRPSRKKKINN